MVPLTIEAVDAVSNFVLRHWFMFGVSVGRRSSGASGAGLLRGRVPELSCFKEFIPRAIEVVDAVSSFFIGHWSLFGISVCSTFYGTIWIIL